tara:strand:- start:152 stop:1006 length:855 start_codon:yes stop_codon:yes gene_type:complete
MRKTIVINILFSTVFMQNEYLVTIDATSYSDWVYYSFETHSIIDCNNDGTFCIGEDDWDIGFQRKHMRTNGGLSGNSNGGAFVNQAILWTNEWENITELPDDMFWQEDTVMNDFYDLNTHTYVEGVKNPALNEWGHFDNSFVLNPTNHVMFVKCANGQDVVKFWAYDYYENRIGGVISFRYETGYQNNILSTNKLLNDSFQLLPSYPNPFNPKTTINYHLNKSSEIKINIYNINGMKVSNIFDGIQNYGFHSIVWDAKDLTTGLYFVKINTNQFSETQKLMLIK